MPEYKFTPSRSRSENMRRIRDRNTRPEIITRKLFRKLGFKGYRLNRKTLPGKPDIVFINKKRAVFVHGCFWHGHKCPIGVRKPKSNTDYWIPKINGNMKRDKKNIAELKELGWKVLVIWECKLLKNQYLEKLLISFMSN